MPTFNITIEDTSPIISYSPGWRAGHSADDKLANLYSQSSFTVTNAQNAFASFTFNGTGVGIYGTKRSNHGLYQVKLDSTLYPPGNGSVPDPGIFQEPLFSVGSLTQGLHTVTLTNQEGRYLDIDFITWETTIGANTDDKLYVDTFQDTSPSFTYLPSEGDWGVSPKNLGSFLGGSGHATTRSDAALIYSFNGDGVSLFGPVGPDGSPYIVQVDNGPTSAFTAKKEFYVPQSLLYHGASLGPGSHNLTLTHQPNTPQQTFAIDYAAVFTTVAPSNTTQMGHDGGKMTSVAIGALSGMAVSIALLLIVSGVLFRLLWRQHGTRGKYTESAQDVFDPYQDNAAVSTVQMRRPPPTMHQAAIPSTYLNQNRHRFTKQGLRPVDHRTGESVSTLHSTLESTSQTPSSVARPPFAPPRSENPPQYTEEPLDSR